MSGHVVTGLMCPSCGRPTVSCEYYWSGFGDSWDNFVHRCKSTGCEYVEEQLGIPGRFPKENAADWAHCPFCGRTSEPLPTTHDDWSF
jgi:hypothetical protein